MSLNMFKVIQYYFQIFNDIGYQKSKNQKSDKQNEGYKNHVKAEVQSYMTF